MVLRLNGFSSGFDVDGAVTQLMQARRVPLDKMNQKRQTLEWQRQDYRDMNKSLLDFRSNKLFNYRLEGTFLAKKLDVSGTADSITAKANTNAQPGTIKIDVNTLATSASKISVDIRREGAAGSTFDPSKPLYDQRDKLGGSIASGTYTLSINGKKISVDASSQSLNDVITQINQKTDVNAFYDSATGKMSFTSKSTGAVAKINFDGSDTGFVNGILKVDTSTVPTGTDATLTINGIVTTRPTNTFTVDGVDITINKPGSSTLTVKTDTDKILDSIKGFINDYNEMLKKLQDKVDEPRYRTFAPLTDEQKNAMKDKEVELWEAKSKSGLLKNDDILSQVVLNMRMAVSSKYDTGNDQYTTLSSIGIETGTYTENGKLYLKDEKELRAAIEADPNAIANLFAGKGGENGESAKIGLAEKMYTSMKTALDNITKKAGYASMEDSTSKDNSFIGEQLYRLSQDIDNKNKSLKEIENRYYRQFTSMETAMNKYNSQSSYLSNFFGGGTQQ